MTGLKHLNRLSAVRSNAGIRFLTPCACPGSHCPLHPALALAGNIRGLSSLVIGTPECTIYSRTVLSRAGGEQKGLHWMYVLDAHEVVFGCRKGLMEALHEMDRAGAKAILLIGTCVPELIGEDIEGIVREAQPGLSARLTSIMVGHFKCNSLPSGSWKTLKAIGSLMEPRPVRSHVINVLGRGPHDRQPAPPLLTALEQRGFTLRCLAPGAALEDFMEAPDAALNLVLSPFPDQLAVDMEKAFGIPLFRLHDLYDPGEIAGMYDAIAARLGIQWGDTFDSGRREAAAFQEQVKSKMEGLRYVCTKIGPYQTLPLAVYLADLGLEPVLLHLEEFWPGDTVWAKALNKKGWDPLVCHMVNGPADAAVVDEMSVDICLGELPGRKAKIPAVPQLSDLYGMTGYERTINLLQKLLCALDGNGAAQEERSDKRGAI